MTLPRYTHGVLAVESLRVLPADAALCESAGCINSVAHVEHWYEGYRLWCESCVPMSGHYEHCPDPCADLMKEYAVRRDALLTLGFLIP